MLRRSVTTLIAFLFLAGAILAADKTYTVTLVKVDVKKNCSLSKTARRRRNTRSTPRRGSWVPKEV